MLAFWTTDLSLKRTFYVSHVQVCVDSDSYMPVSVSHPNLVVVEQTLLVMELKLPLGVLTL